MRIIAIGWTITAFLDGRKTVTRRTWKKQWVKEGDLVQAYSRSPRVGGKPIGTIQIISVRQEPLNSITDDDVKKEGGFWNNTEDFIGFFLKNYPEMKETDLVWRIEFEKV